VKCTHSQAHTCGARHPGAPRPQRLLRQKAALIVARRQRTDQIGICQAIVVHAAVVRADVARKSAAAGKRCRRDSGRWTASIAVAVLVHGATATAKA